MATMDIKSAYLNAALPLEADWIVTTLANALYGLPDSGRLFYQHYKAALLAEGYTMSAFDNCLFYKTTATETTYIIVYVDDTFPRPTSAITMRSPFTAMPPASSASTSCAIMTARSP